MKRFVKFDKFENVEVVTEKKKPTEAQIEARKKFAEMVASKKKDKPEDTKEVEKGEKCACEKGKETCKECEDSKNLKPKDEKKPKAKKKKVASFGEHTGGFKP